MREIADLALRGPIPGEECRGGEHACEQERGVDGRELGFPGAGSGVEVQKMVVEALVARGVWLAPLLAAPEESQRGERARHGVASRHESALHRSRTGREPESHRRNAGRRTRTGGVGHQPVGQVGFPEEVGERPPLDGVQHARLALSGARESGQQP